MKFLDKIREKRWKAKFLIKDGHPCAVLRPADPALALKLLQECQAREVSEQGKAFDEILNAQPYQFRGYLFGQKGIVIASIIDSEGNFVEYLQPGDSFVPAQFESFGKLSVPGWVKVEVNA